MRDDSGVGDGVGVTTNEAEQPEGFYAMKQRFLANRNENTALAMLDQLTSLDTGNIDAEVWPEVKDLIVCLLDSIGAASLVQGHQLLLLNALGRCCGRVVALLADYIIKHEEDMRKALSSSHIAITIAFARRVTDPQCAQSVAEFLWRFAGLKAVQDELKSQLGTSDAEARFRIHQVAASALKNGEDGSAISEPIEWLSTELETRDVLSQLNAVELLADAASQCESAAAYLLRAGVVDRMYKLLQDVKEHPDAGFVFPAVIKFFGHLSVTDVQCLRQYPLFLRSLFDLVHHFDLLDVTQRLLAFDTLALLARKDDAKLFLNTLQDDLDMSVAMNAFGAAACSGPLELRIRHLEALTMTLCPCATLPIKEEVSTLVHSWFNELGAPFPSVLLTYASKPFPDIRCVTLRFLTALFRYQWAITTFMQLPGFLECVLNRNTETTMEGKQLKFDLVCRLIDEGSSLILAEDMLKLKLYRKEGPLYVDRPPQIDMQNE